MSRAPATECLPAHARVCYARRRPNLYGSLTGRERRRPLRQAYPIPVWPWAVVPDLYCTGRWFKLECKLRFASVRSSDEFVVRVSPPDPDTCQMVLPQGLFIVRRQRSRFAARVPRAPLRCVHACVVARARHSRVSLRNGPGPLRRIICSLRSPLTFRDESCAAPSRSLDSRKSGHIRPTQTFVQASVWPEAQGKQTIAPSLLTTLAGCAPPRARPRRRFSTVENRSHRHPRQHACKHR